MPLGVEEEVGVPYQVVEVVGVVHHQEEGVVGEVEVPHQGVGEAAGVRLSLPVLYQPLSCPQCLV